jgi:hypothetical protein
MSVEREKEKEKVLSTNIKSYEGQFLKSRFSSIVKRSWSEI